VHDRDRRNRQGLDALHEREQPAAERGAVQDGELLHLDAAAEHRALGAEEQRPRVVGKQAQCRLELVRHGGGEQVQPGRRPDELDDVAGPLEAHLRLVRHRAANPLRPAQSVT